MATDIHELAILFDASGLGVSDFSFKEGGAARRVGTYPGAIPCLRQSPKS